MSNTPKFVSELEVNYGNVGAFFRGRAFYDIENEHSDRERTPLAGPALRRVGSRAEFLDAYGWAKFDVGDMPGEIRVGKQVLSWGESTFIQNSINTINPVDVSALRVPGAELREALLPEAMVVGSISPTDNIALEGFYLGRLAAKCREGHQCRLERGKPQVARASTEPVRLGAGSLLCPHQQRALEC